ncbi:MAG: hypothetical protein AABY18_06505 [Candidatus Thermoplasmatota archaeon]
MSRLLLRGSLACALAALFLLALLPAPAAANPAVPYCLTSAAGLAGVGAPNAANPDLCETLTGRVFPEASVNSIFPSPNALPGADAAGSQPAQDYVSFYEFQAGLDYLAASPAGQKYMTVHEVAQSTGLCPQPGCADGDRVRFPIYMLELTNKESPVPLANRQSMLFMLSIHGNEKGGREGGFRVLEDLVKGIGFAAETVQGGAGMPGALEKPTGGNVETYHDYLDFMRVFLLFPNADGWAHDEVPFVASEADLCGTLFCRGTGGSPDLNRQAPTSGWQDPTRNMVGEPESIGYYNWMLQQGIVWSYAIDIHGMLNHKNFGAIMMPAGAMTAQEMQRSVRLAETLKTRLNDEADGHFAAWTTVFGTAELADAAEAPCDTVTGQVPPTPPVGPIPSFGGVDCPAPSSALGAVGSTQFAEYYTVIDAIGYTDSGFNGDYFAQDTGLNAPGYDIELAYNHITTDSQYEGPGSIFNDYHVKMVREIVKSFLDASALDVRISFETRGLRTMYVESSYVATSADDTSPTPGGWASENPGDDLWDYGTTPDDHFAARPAKYWEDLKPFVREGDAAGVLVKATASQITSSHIADFQQIVIPGSAIRDLEGSPATIQALKAWAEAGGNLVLTDEGLRFFELAGIVQGDDAVNVTNMYMGGIGITDLSKPVFHEYQVVGDVNRNVRGGVKQTYEPTPLGFEEGAYAAPNWYIAEEAFTALGGDPWGYACGSTSINDRCDDSGRIGLGVVPLGQGKIQFIGSLLPDPTEEFYHPYGLDPYATTYSGNQILRNMLYWGNVLDNPPVVITADGQILQSTNEPLTPGEAGAQEPSGKKKDTPAVGLVVLLGALAALAVVRRRW